MRRLVLLLALAVPLIASRVAAQTPHCHKGKLCGHTCIARWKTCHIGTATKAPATTLPTSALPASTQFVASSRGHVYYAVTCSAWHRLSPANLIYFKSAQEAQAAGYTPSRSHGCAGPSEAADSVGAAGGASCGVERWPVKVLSEADVSEVDTTPEDASVEELRELPRPADLQRALRAPAERHVYRIEGNLIGWTEEQDSDLHLVLGQPGDRSETLIAEIPAPSCAETTAPRFVADFKAARATVLHALGPAPSGYAELIRPLRVTVTGAAFFDFPHNQHGLAPNAIELHPVLRIEFERMSH